MAHHDISACPRGPSCARTQPTLRFDAHRRRNRLCQGCFAGRSRLPYSASGLIAAGCDVVTVQRAMGHASATTLSTYAHLWPTAEERRARRPPERGRRFLPRMCHAWRPRPLNCGNRPDQ